MDFIKNSLIFSLIFMFCFCYQQSQAIDITDILSKFPEFSSFSNYLTQTGLVKDINKHNTITILAVDNGGTGSLSGQGIDFVRTIMSIHVLLDYYDISKLRTMAGGSALPSTLYQTTGNAVNNQGYVNLTITTAGAVLFSSGDGSSGISSLVKTVVAQPYNISVLQISGLIYPKGIQNGAPPPPPPPPPPPSQGTLAPPPSPTVASPPLTTNTTSPPSPSATNTTSPPSPSVTNTTSPPSPSPSSTNTTTNTTSPPSPATSPAPSTAPTRSPKIAPSLGSAPSPGPLADGPVEADKAGSSIVRFSGGLIMTVVAISSWLTMG